MLKHVEIYSGNHAVFIYDQDKHYCSSGHESYALKSSPSIHSVFQANIVKKNPIYNLLKIKRSLG